MNDYLPLGLKQIEYKNQQNDNHKYVFVSVLKGACITHSNYKVISKIIPPDIFKKNA